MLFLTFPLLLSLPIHIHIHIYIYIYIHIYIYINTYTQPYHPGPKGVILFQKTRRATLGLLTAVSLKEGRDGTGSTEKIEKEETKETTKGGRKVVKDGRNEGRIGAKKRKKRRKDWCERKGVKKGRNISTVYASSVRNISVRIVHYPPALAPASSQRSQCHTAGLKTDPWRWPREPRGRRTPCCRG